MLRELLEDKEDKKSKTAKKEAAKPAPSPKAVPPKKGTKPAEVTINVKDYIPFVDLHGRKAVALPEGSTIKPGPGPGEAEAPVQGSSPAPEGKDGVPASPAEPNPETVKTEGKPANETPPKRHPLMPNLPVVKQLTAPQSFHNIQTPNSGVRIIIIDTQSTDWSELLCYNWDSRAIQHLKREDLSPKEAVDETIEFLQELHKARSASLTK